LVSSSANPSVSGQSVTFTATVTAKSPGGATPTGTVTFKDGLSTLDTGTLNSSSQARFMTSTLAVGSHSIASYGGDALQGKHIAQVHPDGEPGVASPLHVGPV